MQGPDGQSFKVTKGAPHVVIALLADPHAMAAAEVVVQRLGQRGVRALAVARADTADTDGGCGQGNFWGARATADLQDGVTGMGD